MCDCCIAAGQVGNIRLAEGHTAGRVNGLGALAHVLVGLVGLHHKEEG